MKILVLGLGNPILTDDGVGMHVVRAAATRCSTLNDVTMAPEMSPESHTVPRASVDLVIFSNAISRLDHQTILLQQTGEVSGHPFIIDVVT